MPDFNCALEPFLGLQHDIVLLPDGFILALGRLAPELPISLLNDVQVLLDQLVSDYFHVAHRIHSSLCMCDLLTAESPNQMIQRINLHHMRQKLIPEPITFRGAFH